MSSSRRPLVGSFSGIGMDITDADDAFCAMLGYTPAEFRRTREQLLALSPPEVASVDEAALEHALAHGGVAPPYEKVFVRADGSHVPVLVTLAYLSPEDRHWVAYAVDLSRPVPSDTEPLVAGHRDGTAQELFWRLVGALIGERSRTQAMLDSSSSLIWAVDTDLVLRSANRAFHRANAVVAGQEYGIGKPVLVPSLRPDVRAAWRQRYERALVGSSFSERTPVDVGDRRWWYDTRFTPIRDAEGSVTGVSVVATDVTEAVGAEHGLAESAKRFQALFENVSDLALLMDDGYRITSVTPSILEVLGFEPADAVGQEVWSVFGADDITPPVAELGAALAVPGAKVHALGRLTDAAGRSRWLDVTIVNLLDDPAVGAIAASVRDVTAEREAAARLASQESLLRIAGRLGRIAGWALDLPGRGVRFSEEMGPVLGLADVTDVPLERSLTFYPEPWRTEIREVIERCLAEGTPFDCEAEVEPRPGERMTLRVVGEARRDEQGSVVGIDGAVSDITVVKRIEAELRRQAGVLDAAMFGITIQDLDGTITYWNRAAADLYGWEPHEAVGRHITELVGETDMGEFDKVSAELEARGAWTGRIVNRHRSGREFPVNLQVTLIRDDAGRPLSRFSVAADISDRVELEERLALSQKLDALGQLTGGIAHDFNNLLTVILGSAEMLHAEVAGHPQQASLAQMLLTAAERGAELTNRLLAFARRQALRPEVVDPVAVIDSMFPLLRRSLPEHVEMEVVHEDGVWPVLVDPGQLEAALMNIAVNARDAMERGGLLRILTSNVRMSEGDAERHLGASPGDYVRITVSDTGIGMGPEVVEHAFDPFYTTKEVGRGSGLGLSMVYGFAQQSDGYVELLSEPGEGTTIMLHLPRIDRTPALDEAAERAPTGAHGECVLVVEDEPLVRGHAAGLLRELGYEVTEAGTGPEAVALLRGGAPADLLFTDVVMPGGMTGVELVREARALRPDLPVLYTSGYTDGASAGAELDAPLLQKPYKRETLARLVREVLDGHR